MFSVRYSDLAAQAADKLKINLSEMLNEKRECCIYAMATPILRWLPVFAIFAFTTYRSIWLSKHLGD